MTYIGSINQINMDSLKDVLKPEIIIFLIPIVAIVAWSVRKIVKMKFDHDERIARIEAGLDRESENHS